ncbi:hypothetical protein GCM10009630_04200 [Kribbella jejuensis]|uniref:DUF8175 domain-containing protein n=1 Tax=Kribbella jejuensis TaxID=236068 RepID=A0A542EU81_9ACTN|nr:hypothetical protein [Kribbella jejuensis]TQJ18875.1 hypothetical protein FB475_3029 [Kribbella jejuensis]
MGLFSRDPDSDEDTDGTALLQQRGFVAGAIVVVALILCLVVFLVLRGGSGSPSATPSRTPSTDAPTGQPTDVPTDEPSGPPATPDPTATSTTPRVTPPPANNTVGGCHVAKPSQAIPRYYAPTAVTWQFEGNMLIPLQVAGGPAATRPNGVKYCFAHSPTGAVLAAMVLLGQVQNRSIALDVLNERVVPGPGQLKAIAQTKADLATPADTTDVQFVGFKVVSYPSDGSQAIIQIASQLGDQGVGALLVTMQWYKGDWRAVLQDDGSFNGTVEPDILSSLNGYVRFSGSS